MELIGIQREEYVTAHRGWVKEGAGTGQRYQLHIAGPQVTASINTGPG